MFSTTDRESSHGVIKTELTVDGLVKLVLKMRLRPSPDDLNIQLVVNNVHMNKNMLSLFKQSPTFLCFL